MGGVNQNDFYIVGIHTDLARNGRVFVAMMSRGNIVAAGSLPEAYRVAVTPAIMRRPQIEVADGTHRIHGIARRSQGG